MITRRIIQNGSAICKGQHFLQYVHFPKFSWHVWTESPSTYTATVCRGCCSISSYPSRYFDFSHNQSTNRYGPYHPLNSHQYHHANLLKQSYSTSPANPEKGDKSDKESVEKKDNPTEESEQNLTLFQRFKLAYKQHGKVLIGVHIFTSVFWAAGCYYAVTSGVDVVGILEWCGTSEIIVSKFRSSHLGDIAAAYLCYKLLTPARYTVTLGGTNFTIKYLQRQGKMPKATERERLKDLVKDGRQELKAKRKEIKEEREERKVKRNV